MLRLWFRCFAVLAALTLSTQALAATAGIESGTRLQRTLDALAQRARPGTLGVAVLDLRGGVRAAVHADQAFPMMSVFKAPVAAAILAGVDAGRVSLQQEVTVSRDEVVDGSAVPSVGSQFRGEEMRFTVERLLQAAVSQSDSTAADALLKVAGGPQAVTAFLRAHGIEGMRIDMGEGGVMRIFQDLRPGQELPAHESAQASRERYRRGFSAFLAAPDNRSTPQAALDFLRQLHAGTLLSAASTRHLLDLMAAQTVPRRLRAGVPPGIRLADKTGSSGSLDGWTPAYNDIGILSGADGHTVLVAAFLTDSHASAAERDALFADIARAAAALIQR
jgi:beta-lactamase class A